MNAQPLILAHAFGARYDLPIHLWLFLVGGGLAVVLSFLVAERRTVEPNESDFTADTPYVRPLTTTGVVLGVLSLLVLLFYVLVGLLGSQEVPENILPTTFWLVAWIIVPLTCGIIGDWTQLVNPFAALAKFCDRPALRRRVLSDERPIAWRLGWWPAVALFFLTSCGELVYNLTATLPRVTASALAIYALVSAFCGLVFGPVWLERGEMFSVLFGTWGRLGLFRLGAKGRRGFAGGLDVPFEPSTSRCAFVLLLLVSVNFDGLLATPQWANHLERDTLKLTRLHPDKIDSFRTLSFLVLAALVALLFGSFAVWAMRAVGQRGGFRASLAELLPSMLPIAFGYLVAHNLQYVLVNTQLLLPLIGNPTGLDSWPITLPYPFNDDFEPHPKFLPSAFYWYAAVLVIVVVHIVAVVIAHRHLTLRSNDDRTAARRGEYRWLVVMVAYTVLSLWLLAQPLVKEAEPKPSALGNPAVSAVVDSGRVVAAGVR